MREYSLAAARALLSSPEGLGGGQVAVRADDAHDEEFLQGLDVSEYVVFVEIDSRLIMFSVTGSRYAAHFALPPVLGVMGCSASGTFAN